jgi:hypothetical protein
MARMDAVRMPDSLGLRLAVPPDSGMWIMSGDIGHIEARQRQQRNALAIGVTTGLGTSGY